MSLVDLVFAVSLHFACKSEHPPCPTHRTLSWQAMLSPLKGQTAFTRLQLKKEESVLLHGIRRLSTSVFPAEFARRFVASSLQNKMFPPNF